MFRLTSLKPFRRKPNMAGRGSLASRHPRRRRFRMGMSAHPGWPESTGTIRILDSGVSVRLRPLRAKDGRRWCHLRMRDQRLLQPVEPTQLLPWETVHSKAGWRNLYSFLRELADAGELIPMAIEVDGVFAGQISLGAIHQATETGGQVRWVGYWLAREYYGKGIATAACSLLIDHAFSRVGVVDLTATTLPENIASQKVLEHAGFIRDYSEMPQLHIDGTMRTHIAYSLRYDDYLSSSVDRLIAAGRVQWVKRS